MHPKLAVAHARLQAAVKTGRALAHADDPMPAADRAGGVLTVTSNAADPIAITCAANVVKVNGVDPAPTQPCDVIAAVRGLPEPLGRQGGRRPHGAPGWRP